MTDVLSREDLVESVERHEEELEVALTDLRRAVQRPFAAGTQVRASIVAHPLPWMAAGLLLGIYLGGRRGSE